MTGPHCHLWNGSLPGILHTQSVTVNQWAICCATPAATAISSLQTPCNSSMTHETAPSGKWVTRHPASRQVSGIVTPRLLQRPLERTWLPSSCAPTQRRLMPCLDRPTAVSSCSQRWKSSNLSRPTRHSYRTSISTIFFFNCAAHLFAVCSEEPVSLFLIELLLLVYMLFQNKRLVIYGNRLWVCWLVAIYRSGPRQAHWRPIRHSIKKSLPTPHLNHH